MKAFTDPHNSRKIQRRLIVEGELHLTSPAHFGNGDADEFIDMPLLVDALDGHSPFLSGASIAGALRAYLSELGVSNTIFGGDKQQNAGEQSSLIVEDAIGIMPENTLPERRWGNRINDESGTAEHNALFDYVLWPVGTRFPIRFELLLCEGDDHQRMNDELFSTLKGLSNGEIHLGARKQRGFGCVKVDQWKIREYNLQDKDDLQDWVLSGAGALSESYQAPLPSTTLEASSNRFTLEARLQPLGSLIIRAGDGKDDLGADATHLKRQKASGESELILSGNTLGGVLRSRCLRIAKTLGTDAKIVNQLFGNMENDHACASKLRVEESVIKGARNDLIQSRVRIDRWTGGAADSALFDAQPAFAGEDSNISIKLSIKKPERREVGLLLLAFKDLATEDLPVGGESSIGRGRLCLKEPAKIKFDNKQYELAFEAEQQGPEDLEACVQALVNGRNEL